MPQKQKLNRGIPFSGHAALVFAASLALAACHSPTSTVAAVPGVGAAPVAADARVGIASGLGAYRGTLVNNPNSTRPTRAAYLEEWKRRHNYKPGVDARLDRFVTTFTHTAAAQQAKPFSLQDITGTNPTITLVAGTPFTQGDVDGPALTAQFEYIFGMEVGSDGTIYIADPGVPAIAIRQVSPSGIVSTIAGSGEGQDRAVDGNGLSATFASPMSLAVDASRNIYVADEGNNKIRKISPTNDVTTLAGESGVPFGFVDGIGKDARFAEPNGICIDHSGNLLVWDNDNSALRKVTPSGVVTTIVGQQVPSQYYTPGTSGYIDGPASQALFGEGGGRPCVDSQSNIYAGDELNGVIRKISPDLIVSTFAGTHSDLTGIPVDGKPGVIGSPISGLAINSSGLIYFIDSSRYLRTVNPMGEIQTLIDTESNPLLKDPYLGDDFFSVAIGPDDVVYMASATAIYRVGPPTAAASLTVSDPNATTPPLPGSPIAFSPNGDNVKDTVKLTVKAAPSTAWVITVPDPNDATKTFTVATGTTDSSGTLTVQWDGTAKKPNGTSLVLKDGTYTLSVTAKGVAPAPTDSKQDVTIDTVKPDISMAHVEKMESQDDGTDDVLYTIQFEMKNPEKGKANSDFDLDSVKLEKVNTTFTPVGKAMKVSDGLYQLAVSIPLGDCPELKFTVDMSDLAGNPGTQDSGLGIDSDFAGMPVDGDATCSVPTNTGYKVLQLAPPTSPVAVGYDVLTVLWLGRDAATLFAEDSLTDLGTDLRDYCLVPADEGYPDIANLQANTPFLCPQGKPLQYKLVVWEADSSTLKAERPAPPVEVMNLDTTVTFSGENARGRPDFRNKGVWYRDYYTVSNVKDTPPLTWNGKSYDVLHKSTIKAGKVAFTGNYSVTLDFGKLPFSSPNQKSRQRVPAGIRIQNALTSLPPENQTLVGFRVISNVDDRPGFGPNSTLPGQGADAPEPAGADDFGDTDQGFNAWKRFIGPAGRPTTPGIATYDWHHVVEQYQNQFTMKTINRQYNMMRIPHNLHLVISEQYGYAQPKIVKANKVGPLRDWLKSNMPDDFEGQRKIGIDMLRKYCKYDFASQTDTGVNSGP